MTPASAAPHFQHVAVESGLLQQPSVIFAAGPQVAYGIGQVAGQIFRDVPSLLLLFFMTNALGVSPALAGTAIFGPKLVMGLICDFGVGAFSDRVGKVFPRRWWLIIGALGAPPAMILLFHVPAFGQYGRALYVACAFSLYMLVFATASVPYLAIAGELPANPQQRTVIMAWRLVFTAVGVLIADSLAPIFIQRQGAGQPAYEQMSLILAAICTASLIVAFFGAAAMSACANGQLVKPADAAPGLREALRALAQPRFSILLLANLFQLAGGGMGYASMLYFLTYNLHRMDAFLQIGLITLVASFTIVFAQPLWVFLAKRWGKKTTYIVSSLLYAATMLGWGVLGKLGPGVYYALALLMGISNSGWTLLGYSMVTDVTGGGRAGLYSSAWIAADKIGFALGGTLLVGLVLSAFGFDAPRAMAGLPQSHHALIGVLLVFSVLPGLLSVTAAAIFARWGSAAA